MRFSNARRAADTAFGFGLGCLVFTGFLLTLFCVLAYGCSFALTDAVDRAREAQERGRQQWEDQNVNQPTLADGVSTNEE